MDSGRAAFSPLPSGPSSSSSSLSPPPPLSSPFQSVGTPPTSRPQGGQAEPRGLGRGGGHERLRPGNPGAMGAVGKPGRRWSRTGGHPLSGVPGVPPPGGGLILGAGGGRALGLELGWSGGPLSKEVLPLGRREAGSQAPKGGGVQCLGPETLARERVTTCGGGPTGLEPPRGAQLSRTQRWDLGTDLGLDTGEGWSWDLQLLRPRLPNRAVCVEVSRPKHARRDSASGDPAGVWGTHRGSGWPGRQAPGRGRRQEGFTGPTGNGGCSPRPGPGEGAATGDAAQPARGGSGRGCALFPESRGGGPRWPCPAQPLSSAPALSHCPLALMGLPSRAACRHRAVPHLAGPPQSLDAGPLGRWTALGSAAPGNGRVPQTTHAAAAFTFRPMLKIAWIGPLLEVKSCLLRGGLLLLLWLTAVTLPKVGLVGRSCSLMWTEGCAGQGLGQRLLLPHALPAWTKDGPTLGLAPRRGAGQALTCHRILAAVGASLLFAKVTRGLRKTPGGPYPPGPSRTMSLWGCPRGPPSYTSSFGEGAGLPVDPGEAGCPQGAAGLPPSGGSKGSPAEHPGAPQATSNLGSPEGSAGAVAGELPPRGTVSPRPSSAGCQGDSPGLELRDARGPV